MDYTIIGVIQLAAMIYGVYIVAGTRPVYVAFNRDRFEVVTARDIEDQELAAARDPAYADLPLDGPRLVAVQVPREEQQDALFQSLAGNEEHQRPKFFAPYQTALEKIRKRAKPRAGAGGEISRLPRRCSTRRCAGSRFPPSGFAGCRCTIDWVSGRR